MPFPWQDVAAMAVAVAAAGYLIYRGWLIVAGKKNTGCGGGGCSACPTPMAKTPDGAKPMVSVDDIRSPRENSRSNG